MASPFSIFRRNQKIMLAVVAIGAMVAFVFLTPLSYLSGSRKVQNPVVVETRYGDLTNNELDSLRFQREIVDRFLLQITNERVVRQLGQANLDSRWLSGLVENQYMMVRNQLMGRYAQGPEEAAVETMVLAERAQQMGIVVTDQAINDLLKQLTADSINATELREIIRRLSPQRPVGVPRLFDALRTEMLASTYMQLFQLSLNDLPPAQRFEYYARLNRRAKAEVMPLAVSEFIPQVADPSDAEVRQLYDKYKNDLPDPVSPEPGFKEPERATFQYFKANVEELTEKLKSEVTEAEISQYYEENKRNFPALGEDAAADAGAEEGAAPAAQQPEGEPAKEEMKEEGTPPDESAPAEDADKPADEPKQPAEDAPSDDQPADKAPTDEKPTDEKPADGGESDGTSPQASYRAAGQVFRLTSMAQQEQSEASEPEQPADDSGATEPAAAPQEKPASQEEPAAPEESTEEKSTEEPSADETPAAEKPAGDNPADAVVPRPTVQDEEPQFEPLEKVADTIRATLAREKAIERITEQFDALSAKMRSYAADYDRYTVEKGNDARATPPKPLNFTELAAGKDVQSFELQSASPAEADKDAIGKSFRAVQTSRGPQAVSFADFAYSDTLPEFRPETTQDNDNNVYLFWRTQLEPPYVPPLDQIRDKVVRAWKMTKARDLARKRAQEYADQAHSLGKSLTELIGSEGTLKVTETEPFSWLTFGNVPVQPGVTPHLSEVEGVELAGEEFMKTVFGLSPGEFGVAINEPQDTVYVVRLIDFEPSLDELRDAFAREQPSRYLAAAMGDQRQIYETWIKDLNTEADVHWVRQADARRSTEDDEEL